jgi:hypothetical protein
MASDTSQLMMTRSASREWRRNSQADGRNILARPVSPDDARQLSECILCFGRPDRDYDTFFQAMEKLADLPAVIPPPNFAASKDMPRGLLMKWIGGIVRNGTLCCDFSSPQPSSSYPPSVVLVRSDGSGRFCNELLRTSSLRNTAVHVLDFRSPRDSDRVSGLQGLGACRRSRLGRLRASRTGGLAYRLHL